MIHPPNERSLMSAFLVGRLELARLLEDRIEETGLTALEAVVVRTVLVNRAATVGAIRQALALRASTAGSLVGRLAERGYVRRDADPSDRRAVVVRLTGPGTTIAEMVAAAVSELDGEIASIAETDLSSVTRAVDAIELMASRERRLRLRTW
jgi:DNA-binding MarR family transcriptional regulator